VIWWRPGLPRPPPGSSNIDLAHHLPVCGTERTRYTGRMEFEWDPSKATGNLRKHKVSFEEAATVFGDFLGTTFPDPDHSSGERRYVTVGLSNKGRLLMVAHAERGERIRIISARKLTRSEKGAYEETES
jgi:uncharacterized DUF497 family protein